MGGLPWSSSLLFHLRTSCVHKTRITAPLRRTQSHATALIAPTKLGRSGPQPRFGPCRTLKSELMVPSDFRDISGMSSVTVQTEHNVSTLNYYQRTGKRACFPPSTHGFLYYHHVLNTPPTSGQIRFRVTPEHDKYNFAGGSDLLLPGYLPWSLSLFHLARHTKNQGLWDLVRQEGFIDSATADWVSTNCKTNFGWQMLHYLEQPFVLDLQSVNLALDIITPQTLGRVSLWGLLMVTEGGKRVSPYRVSSRTVSLRVLKILQPIVVLDPAYIEYLPIPKEGEVLRRPRAGRRSKIAVVTIDLDTDAMTHRDLKLLAE
ncbi:hypothetical protein H0H92_000737 [Tricholoma furcatifolium]|nr:hypothetical protein H0H92_000737 [Tricholoma furcatifolium]